MFYANLTEAVMVTFPGNILAPSPITVGSALHFRPATGAHLPTFAASALAANATAATPAARVVIDTQHWNLQPTITRDAVQLNRLAQLFSTQLDVLTATARHEFIPPAMRARIAESGAMMAAASDAKSDRPFVSPNSDGSISSPDCLRADEPSEEELARLAKAAETAPASAEYALRLIREMVRLSSVNIGKVMEEWRAVRERIHGQDAITLHEAVARMFFRLGVYYHGLTVLEAIPEEAFTRNPELRTLRNDLRLMEEADHLGNSVFPLGTEFDTRWNGPRLRKDLVGNPALLAWYPGKIEAIGEQNTRLLLGQQAPDGDTELFTADLDRGTYEAAGIRFPDGISVEQHLEVYVINDGGTEKTVVALDRPPVFGVEPIPDLLRFLEVELDGFLPDDPPDPTSKP
jgi:hypothetical protein